MAKVIKLGGARRNLSGRRSVTVELPEFLLCALEHRAAAASEMPTDEHVTINNVLEWELADSLSVGEVALLEEKYPGISAAVSEWLREAN